ncbi:MAG: helix-turn-helix domain-containing protein [Steroidobacteraceae bacterium]
MEALREKLAQMVPQQLADIPQILRTMRLITRKSQVEYAKLCGLNPRVLADIERGKGNPSFRSLGKLLKPFGLAIGITNPQEMRAALARNRSLTTGTTSPSGRHARELSAAELSALRGVGALKGKGPVDAGNDPLLRSQAQYMALLEESLSTTEAAKLIKVDVTQVRERLREHSLFGLEYERTWRLPRFQFESRLVIPGLAPVLKALPPDLLPLDVVDWFLLPEPELQLEGDAAPLSPREWLLSGRPTDIVVRLAGDLTRA